jgi:hypothetical protein
MKDFIIECPSGYEIDKEKPPLKKIVYKEIGFKFPESVREIPNRDYYINSYGSISKLSHSEQDSNQLSTKERAEAFLALMQLVELRQYVNGDWKADFTNYENKYTIHIIENKIHKNFTQTLSCVLHFKSEEIRDQFAEKYKDLIETAKELL